MLIHFLLIFDAFLGKALSMLGFAWFVYPLCRGIATVPRHERERAGNTKRLALMALVPLLVVPRAVSAAPSDGDGPIVEAVKQRLSLAERLTLGTPLYIVVEEQMLYVPPPRRLRRIAAEVAKAPEHPDRDRLEVWQRRLRGEGERIRHEIWVADNETIRLANTYPEPGHFSDQASGKDGVWMLGPTRLMTAEAGTLSRSMAGGIVDGIFNHLFYGSARGLARSGGLRVEVISREGRTATVALKADGKPTILWTLEHRPGQGWTLVRSTYDDDARSMLGDEATALIEYEGDEQVPGTDLSLPKTVSLYANDGQPSRRYTLVHAEVVSEAEVEDLAAIPSADRPDPIRGWAGQASTPMLVAPASPEQSSRKPGRAYPKPSPRGAGTVMLFSILVVSAVCLTGVVVLLKRRAG